MKEVKVDYMASALDFERSGSKVIIENSEQSIDEGIDKSFSVYADAIKGVTDSDKAYQILSKIKGVPQKTSELFQKKYGFDNKGNIIWDFKKVVQNFIDDIN